jgi:flagellar biosynthetic protein FliO
MGMLSLKMFLSLILMLGLIFALFFILKRLKLGSLSGNRLPAMRLLGTLSLAPKRGIALVEVCDQWLVIGIGTENVNLISKVDRPEGSSLCDTGMAPGGNMFQSILENIGLSKKTPEITDTRQNVRK